MSSLDRVKQQLCERGFSIDGRYSTEDTGVDWSASKIVLELSQEHEIVRYLVIVPRRIAVNGELDIEDLSVMIVGWDLERTSWFRLAAVSILPDDLMPNLQSIARKLTAAWRALDSGG